MLIALIMRSARQHINGVYVDGKLDQIEPYVCSRKSFSFSQFTLLNIPGELFLINEKIYRSVSTSSVYYVRLFKTPKFQAKSLMKKYIQEFYRKQSKTAFQSISDVGCDIMKYLIHVVALDEYCFFINVSKNK